MFRPLNEKGDYDPSQLTTTLADLNKEYVIQANDLLRVRVFTNRGESILDPNGELRFGGPAGMGSVAPISGGGGTVTPSSGGAGGGGQAESLPGFVVQPDGGVRLPMVGYIKLAGLTQLQADSLLEKRYTEFYKEVFVVTRVTNRRVFVLGAPGGRVVPLTNENMNLLEVLALTGGISDNGKAQNIRLIRGDLKNPQVEQINLQTLNGMRQANLQMAANDVVYIEPLRKPALEALRDVAPFITFLATVLLLTFRINRTL